MLEMSLCEKSYGVQIVDSLFLEMKQSMWALCGHFFQSGCMYSSDMYTARFVLKNGHHKDYVLQFD